MDVTIRCICPPKADGSPRHDEDTVTLRDTLGFTDVHTLRWAVAVQKETNPKASLAESLAMLTEHYLIVGVSDWTVVDVRGRPVEVTREAVRDILLSDDNVDAALAVGDVADNLYTGLFVPLLQSAQKSSPSTPTTESTSARKSRASSRREPSSDTHRTPRKRSSPSSITSIPTDVTVTTTSLHGGDFSTSPKSESAA